MGETEEGSPATDDAQDVAAEGDLIPLSALQHQLFCPRQCALIHVEQVWSENRFTAEGRLLHERTDTPGHEARRGVRTVMSMPLASRALGVSGIADVVELHRGEDGGWRPYPVEYKRGKPKAHRADEVQLCAQAVCLEEMFGCSLVEGALFYGQTRRRVAVALDEELRGLTAHVADEARKLITIGHTPEPVYDAKRCGACSLIDLCRPKRLARKTNVARWLTQQIDDD
jgi:CRISPR-associated exonuclease Cas4